MTVPLRVGTDCSGIGTPLLALRALGIVFHHVFASEIDPQARRTLQANHPADIVYTDLRRRDLHAVPQVDVYIAGFPCQPFSLAGLQHGFMAHGGNGLLFFDILAYIKLKQPIIFILENVAGLLTVDGGQCFHAIWMGLSSLWAYNVHWRVLNTCQHGIPQNRPRVFLLDFYGPGTRGHFPFRSHCQHYLWIFFWSHVCPDQVLVTSPLFLKASLAQMYCIIWPV